MLEPLLECWFSGFLYKLFMHSKYQEIVINVLVTYIGLSPDLQSMEQIRRIMRPTDVPDTGMSLSQTTKDAISQLFQQYLSASIELNYMNCMHSPNK